MSREPDERGVVAVMVALLAVTLFGIGALAVDIGHLYDTRRESQRAADLAALAGGQSLGFDAGDGTAACKKAVAYLQTNAPSLGSSSVDYATLAGTCTDTGTPDGTISITDNGLQLRARVPAQEVAFGLAGALGIGSGSTSASATVALRSPGSTLPLFLPFPCASGSQIIKADSGDSDQATSPEPAPVFSPPGDNGNVPSLQGQPQPASFTVGQAPQLMITGAKFATNGMQVDFTRGTTRFTATPTSVTPGSGPGGDSLTVTAPSGLVAGTWHVRAKNSVGWSRDDVTFAVTAAGAPPPPPTSCGQKATGDFGMMDSPRAGVNGNQQALDRNFALGLDHNINIFTGALPDPSTSKNCQDTGNSPIAGGIFDDDPTHDDANCVDINNGNKVDAATDGLITGGSGFEGRLTNSAPSSCSGDGGNGGRPRTRSFLGVQINNDVLSCYLRPGHTLSEIGSGGSDIIDPSIFDSPRLFSVPLINADVNPQNGFYPIRGFAYVFITDETPTSAATADNGLTGSHSKLTSIRGFVIPTTALPPAAHAGGTGSAFTGGTKDVRLIK